MYGLFLVPDPCTNYTCGEYANCFVENDTAVCACLHGFTGNPYENCTSGKYSNYLELYALVIMRALRTLHSMTFLCHFILGFDQGNLYNYHRQKLLPVIYIILQYILLHCTVLDLRKSGIWKVRSALNLPVRLTTKPHGDTGTANE